MNINLLEKILTEKNQPRYRLKQIKKAIYQDGIADFNLITTLPEDLRGELANELEIISLKEEKLFISNDRRSIKALLKLKDGNLIETVLISPKPEIWSACISCQVGCAMGCGFCATGKMGFKRDLTAEEITDQVLFWICYLRKNKIEGKFSNVVYMGMGEPFLNFENVKESLLHLTDSETFNFGDRKISVSTCAIMDRFEQFAEEFPQVNLAISLHSADNEKRTQMMPINKRYGLEEIKEGLKKYFLKHKRKIFIEYVMIDGFNDSVEDAQKLIDYIKSVGNAYLLHVNLISYNETGGKWKSSPKEKVVSFRDYLLKNSINATIRKSLGKEIQGACGQLAGRE